MIDIITREVTATDLKEVVNKLIPDSIARDIEKACQGQSLFVCSTRLSIVMTKSTLTGDFMILLICTSG